MSFYCQRTRLHSNWAELSSGRTDGQIVGLTVGHAFKRGFQTWQLLRKRCGRGHVRRSRRWRRRQLRLRCRRTRQCQFTPTKWKSKLKDLCTRCGVCMQHIRHTRHTHICTHMHVLFIIFFVGKCDLYEKSQHQRALWRRSMCVRNILHRLRFLNSIFTYWHRQE